MCLELYLSSRKMLVFGLVFVFYYLKLSAGSGFSCFLFTSFPLILTTLNFLTSGPKKILTNGKRSSPWFLILFRRDNTKTTENSAFHMHFKYRKNILISRFYEQFSRNRPFLEVRKIYHLFREIFKCREDKSNNEFCEILKYFRKSAKFEFFTKEIRNLQVMPFKVIHDMFLF